MKDIYGVNICAIEGISGLTGLKILSECGTGIEIKKKFRNAKAFVNWMSLAPNNKITGGKVISSRTRKNNNRAANAFRMCAMTLWNTKDKPLGDFYKKKKAQIGKEKAVTATARKIAVIFYNMVTKGVEYKPELVMPNQENHQQRRLKRISKELQQQGYKIIDEEGVVVFLV